ncbi:MAG: caspase family protein [Pseudomonadota bacterium]
MIRSFFIFTLLAAMALSAQAQKRIALVIGNSTHENKGWNLVNPINDATLIGASLREVGFEVHTVTDATAAEMRTAFQAHGERLKNAGKDTIGLFFFAGHGVQSNNINYLIPTDAKIFSEADVWRDAPRLGDLFLHLSLAGNQTNFVILDACRNNPLPRSFRSAQSGLAQVAEARGTLIAYATKPGAVASDGGAKNSPYTTALAALIRQPGLSAESMFRNVATRVEASTNTVQQPWFESGLRGEKDFCFAGCERMGGTAETEAVDLANALNSNSLGALSAFLSLHPESKSRSLVEREIDRLSGPSGGNARGALAETAPTQRNGVPAPEVGETWEQYAGLVIPGCEADPLEQDGVCQADKIAWSPDGALLAAATSDGMIRIFDIITGREIKAWGSGYEISATDLAWSPDSRLLALTSLWSDDLKIFDARKGIKLATLTKPGIDAIAWDKDSAFLLLPHDQGIDLIGFEEGEFAEFPLVSANDRPISDIRASAFERGQFALAGELSEEAAAFVGDVETFNGFTPLIFPSPPPAVFASLHVSSIDFSSDQTQLVTATFNGWVLVHDAISGEIEQILVEGESANVDYASAINAVDWSADGQRILVTDEDPRVRIFDAATGALVASLEANRFNTDDATFSPAGDRIAVASIDGTLRLWRLIE